MNHVYAYIRVSTVKQGEKGSSLSEQRIAIEAYARKHNLFIVEWFEERETAAKRGRVLFEKMMRQLLQGKTTGVIIHKIDRGARNLRDWSDIGALVDKGIEVHFAHESLDMQSRGGRLAADIQAVVAADFIRNLRDEVRKGFYGRLRQGLYPLPAPIGYLDQGKGQPKIPDPIMGPLVERAFKLYATGTYNLLTLGDEMYRLGLRNKRGGRVTRTGISGLLNNEFYVGIVHIHRTNERFQGIHEPIIKKSLFDVVGQILRGRAKTVRVTNDFLYRKSLKCAHCSYNLTAERQKGHVYYRCHTRDCPQTCVREESIASQADSALGRLHMSEHELQRLEIEFKHIEQDRADHFEDTVKSLALRIANIDERRNRLTDAYIDRVIDKKSFEERNGSLLRERREVSDQIEELRSDPQSFGKRLKKFLELLRSLSDKAFMANPVEKRDTLKSVTSNLIVRQKNLVVKYESPFDIIASHVESINGAPFRDTPRTREVDISELVTKLVTIFDQQVRHQKGE